MRIVDFVFVERDHGERSRDSISGGVSISCGIFERARAKDAEISDDLYDQMEETMLERLRDNTPVVRAQAARALSRLQDGGEDADFSTNEITVAFIELIGGEKNKDARKAILGALAISDHTISVVVERTRDVSEEVRRIAFWR